jgi:nucleoside-diphosphate-sugar epimerase
MPIKVARIFNTYGPRMHPNDGRVVSNFIVQALLGRDITVYGEGLQTCSFCYIDDLIYGLVRLMATPANVTGPVNIGNPTEFKVIELAQMTHLTLANRPSSAARERSKTTPAGHFACSRAARLETARSAQGRLGQDHFLF